jgi:hypothetical protein
MSKRILSAKDAAAITPSAASSIEVAALQRARPGCAADPRRGGVPMSDNMQQRQRQRQTNRRRRCSNASLLNRQLRNRHVSRRP